MMQLHELQPTPGSRRCRKRVGRGISAGQGKTAGRGTKGQKSRSGGGVRPYFEGGQLPFVRRLPFKRGFKNRWRVEYAEVNVGDLDDMLFPAESEVTPEQLEAVGLIRSATMPVVLLGDGEIDRPLTIKVQRTSKSAQQKVEAAGGTVELLPR